MCVREYFGDLNFKPFVVPLHWVLGDPAVLRLVLAVGNLVGLVQWYSPRRWDKKKSFVLPKIFY